jgi:predicted nucleic acid-binding protein
MKLFLDANILFSASNTESNLFRLLRFLKKNATLITSDYAHIEAQRNLHTKRPQWLEGFPEVMDGIEIVTSVDGPVSAGINEKDRPILATAIRHRCDILLTGDKRDFGHLFGQKVEQTTILSPLGLRDILARM